MPVTPDEPTHLSSRQAHPMQRAPQLALLALAQVLVLALWFSASAAAPTLIAAGHDRSILSWLTSAVQAGFVAGTLASAALALPDRMNPRHLFVVSALLGAVANAGLLLVPVDSGAALVLRFVTGAVMAGVYPVGMKLAASWARGDMGLMVGLLVGALTVGSALPHLFGALGGTAWTVTVATASVSAVLGAGVMFVFRAGPNLPPSAPFRPGALLDVWRNRGVRLATIGYLGHMWELYAVWAWIAVFLGASLAAWGESAGVSANFAQWAALGAFATIAVGGLGGVGGGLLADRLGRTTATLIAMAVSGACCLVAGLFFGLHPAWLAALCFVWGVTVVADSAQFSACVAELSEPAYVGTMLTAQTCLGFALTLGALALMPVAVEALGWRYAFVPLSVGPLLGCVAMWRLRRSPMAEQLAGGRG